MKSNFDKAVTLSGESISEIVQSLSDLKITIRNNLFLLKAGLELKAWAQTHIQEVDQDENLQARIDEVKRVLQDLPARLCAQTEEIISHVYRLLKWPPAAYGLGVKLPCRQWTPIETWVQVRIGQARKGREFACQQGIPYQAPVGD